MNIKEYWEELNKMYGTDLELPKMDLTDHSKEIEARVMYGESIDSAIQSTFWGGLIWISSM